MHSHPPKEKVHKQYKIPLPQLQSETGFKNKNAVQILDLHRII